MLYEKDIQQAHLANQLKINMVKQLLEVMKTRQPIHYESIESIEELTQIYAEKDFEVKTLQKAWEELEGLLFSELQTTIQEKNSISTKLGNKRKDDKDRLKKLRKQKTQVWRSENP